MTNDSIELLCSYVVRAVIEPVHSTLLVDFALEFIRQSDMWDKVPFEKCIHQGAITTLKLKSEELI